ncbi:hypothetical protein [Cryptosporangium phraense]|uniref:Uncharacterized protein n=1 Tax=Cryptosporangium phraense TaxID=2593070 RepID=A0A545AR61_9ACTN|nr:hypothetical protein [Cryptosporangium phraense]TQS43807.1 hypothetical protein FL583_17435 [Cryptosporangium phraense]
MTKRRPPLAERRSAIAVGETGPGQVPSHVFSITADASASAIDQSAGLAGALPLRVGGEGTVLAVDPHGQPLAVRLFRPTTTRIVLVGSPRCAQLIAFRSLATGARVAIGTARPQIWTPITAAAPPGTVTVGPVDADPVEPPGRRTRPLLYLDDAPPYGAPPELPAGRWTTILTIREALTHRESELLERADLVAVQPLVPAEVEVLTSVLKLPGIDERLARLPADVLTVAHRRGVRFGRLTVTQTEQHFFGSALRR